jgi:short-subunit dehydrogenase
MRTLTDKVVAITGAGSGIGRCLALEVVRHKGIPVLLDVNEKGLEETTQMVTALGGKSERHILDIRDADQWAAVADKIIASFGHVDVLINNAGVFSLAQSFLDIDMKQARFIFDVNVFGTFTGARTFVPLLAKRPEATLVNVASSLALVATPLYSAYCASKAAVSGLTNVLRDELSGTRIHVMTVFPGPTKTNLGRNVQTDDKAEHDAHANHFEKFAITTPEAVARKVVKGILSNKKQVCTSADSKFAQIMSRLSPMWGHALMAFVMRKVANPKLYARLDALSK